MTLATAHAFWPPNRVFEGMGAATEDHCFADPGAAAHWVYEEASIGFVLSGWFEYAAEGPMTLTAPGSIVLGNADERFTVRHVDTRGNKRLVVSVKRTLIDEVARDMESTPRFGAAVLPPSLVATQLFGLMRTYSRRRSEDALCLIAHAALTAQWPRPIERITAPDRRRVQDVVKHIEAHFDQPCPLQTMAQVAGFSRFHFVRKFSAIVGQSPNQYLINTRIRAAAERLIATKAPIADIAFDVGFNDISHFYACFREAFGCTPRQWRLRA